VFQDGWKSFDYSGTYGSITLGFQESRTLKSPSKPSSKASLAAVMRMHAHKRIPFDQWYEGTTLQPKIYRAFNHDPLLCSTVVNFITLHFGQKTSDHRLHHLTTATRSLSSFFPSRRFRGLFTLSSECFSTFPHGTCLLSEKQWYLELGGAYLPYSVSTLKITYSEANH